MFAAASRSTLVTLSVSAWTVSASTRPSVSGRTGFRALAHGAHPWFADVPVADLQAIISQVNTQGKNLYITQEVLGGVSSGPAGPMHPSDYAGLGVCCSS